MFRNLSKKLNSEFSVDMKEQTNGVSIVISSLRSILNVFSVNLFTRYSSEAENALAIALNVPSIPEVSIKAVISNGSKTISSPLTPGVTISTSTLPRKKVAL